MKKSAFSTMFLSYVSVLGIMILLMTAGHLYNSRLLMNQILSTNRAALDTVRNKIDGKMHELFLANHQIYQNGTIASVARGGKEVTLADREAFLSIGRDLRTYQISAGTDDLLLFFHQKDKVLRQGYLYSRRELYERYYASGTQSYEEWIRAFTPSSPGEYTLVSGGAAGEKEGKVFLTYPILQAGEYGQGTVLALGYRQETIGAWLAEVPVAQGGNLLIVGRGGSIVAGACAPLEEDGLFSCAALFEGPAQTLRQFSSGGESRIASYVPSRRMDWNYVFEMPAGRFWSPSRSLLLFSLCLSLISVGIILFLAYQFSKSHQSKLRAIIDKISELTPGGKTGFLDEYAFIHEKIDLLELEHRKGSTARQNRRLYGLLTGATGEEEWKESLRSLYPLGPRLAVCCVSVTEDSAFVCKTSDAELEAYILIKLFEELYEESPLRVYACSGDGSVWLCLNWGDDFHEELLSRDEVMRRYVEYLDLHFRIRVRVLFSKEYAAPTVGSLRGAYEDCLALLKEGWTLPEKCVCRAGDTGARSGPYQYPAEYERKLIEVIHSGDYPQARRIVENVFSQLDSLSADMALLLLFEVAATAAKAADTPQAQELLEERGVPGLLLKARSVLQKKELTYDLLRALCEISPRRSPEPRTVGYAGRVNAYIEENYADVNLNVTAIADAFHLSPRYLSRLYREETGALILTRLHQERVAAAKRLLVELPDEKIAQIARRVGSADTGSFIRLFKKYTGVTPGDFRRLAEPADAGQPSSAESTPKTSKAETESV